ncbi:MAG TPA: amino acid ABC transporter permease [Ktedonobacteraceae bacterium]|nr:amino acid ABC transporter permease [Ktedonobacteraceae bacterium]
MQQSLPEALPRVTRKPRSWLVILDYLFYTVLVVAVLAFIYYLSTYRDTIALDLPFLLQGAAVTIILSVISVVFAMILGFLGAIGRLSRFAPVRWLATTYVEVVRGTPILVQLLMWYFGIGVVLSQAGFDPQNIAFQFMTVLQSNSLVPDGFTAFFYGVIGLSFNYGAYLTEVFRAGIESVQKGQSEAALSLGLNSSQVMRRIVLPQAIRITMPPFTNNFISLVQDTALLSTIAVLELQQQMSTIADPLLDANKKLFIYILGALVYLAICYPLTLLSRYLEGRMAIAY